MNSDNKQLPLFQLHQVNQEFTTGTETIRILNNISLSINQGETIAITGASGSGKSSLLHLLGTLTTPTSGSIQFLGQEITKLTPEKKAELRNKSMGFVFQFHHMLPEFTTLENVAMQGLIGGMDKNKAFQLAHDLIQQVGLADRAHYNITLLSGGERQRAAIARAILNGPQVLLADEPTGNLDSNNSVRIAELLLKLNQQHKMAMVVVTHNLELASCMQRCFELKSGDLYDQNT